MNLAALMVVLYLLVVLLAGAWVKGRSPKVLGLEDFHLAGRSLKPAFLVGTLCATVVGASSTLGMAGLGYSVGLPGAWWMLSGTAGLLLLSIFLAEKIRYSGCATLPELVGSFYGERVRLAASVLIAISWIGIIAVQIVAAGKILGAVFGGSDALYMAASTAVFVLYTAHGGQRSVVRTDLLQFIIIVTGMVVLFAVALQEVGPSILFCQSFPTSSEMGPWEVVSMLLVVGSAYLVGPDMYSRLLSADSPGSAKRSAFISAMIIVPLALVITFLGIFSARLFPGISSEQAIPALMTGLLSPAALGLVAAAMLAAFMSSADTTLMTTTTILTLDIYRKVRPNAPGEHLVTVSRLMVLAVGAVALAVAVSLPLIIKTLLMAYTVFSSGLLLPVVAGFYRERLRLTSDGALAGLIGGGAAALMWGQDYPLLGLAVSAALLFSVSWLKKGAPD